MYLLHNWLNFPIILLKVTGLFEICNHRDWLQNTFYSLCGLQNSQPLLSADMDTISNNPLGYLLLYWISPSKELFIEAVTLIKDLYRKSLYPMVHMPIFLSIGDLLHFKLQVQIYITTELVTHNFQSITLTNGQGRWM